MLRVIFSTKFLFHIFSQIIAVFALCSIFVDLTIIQLTFHLPEGWGAIGNEPLKLRVVQYQKKVQRLKHLSQCQSIF